MNLVGLFTLEISFNSFYLSEETKQRYYSPFLKANLVKSTDLVHKLPSN